MKHPLWLSLNHRREPKRCQFQGIEYCNGEIIRWSNQSFLWDNQVIQLTLQPPLALLFPGVFSPGTLSSNAETATCTSRRRTSGDSRQWWRDSTLVTMSHFEILSWWQCHTLEILSRWQWHTLTNEETIISFKARWTCFGTENVTYSANKFKLNFVLWQNYHDILWKNPFIIS